MRSCRCERFQSCSDTCISAPTQEDLLCDACREGCNASFGGMHLVQIRLVGVDPVEVLTS